MELEALMETGASLGLTGDDLRRWIDEERRADREQRTAADRYRTAQMDSQARDKMEKERHSLELQERLRQVGALTETSYPIVPHNIPQGETGAYGYRYDGKHPIDYL
ncbi:uncharacterized protein LOC125942722 [Dermacentor silvarum]|uniref:uncharacterized protein LOC125942722 n=1 Tax=Dermacentor silvarum TaxID=543639 RepID=UPI0021007E91|nr:uncharacterized protein LOC125942722 [Dermacentor silvarum]